MGIKEIRETGLLEMFVTGTCSEEESNIVKQAIRDFPELKDDIKKISAALEDFAKESQVEPPAHLKAEILEKAKEFRGSKSIEHKSNVSGIKNLKWISIIGIAGSLLFGILYFNSSRENAALQKEYDDYKILCDSLDRVQELEYAILDEIQDPNNQTLAFTPTDKYNEASFFLISNSETNKNFIQISSLPTITAQQSFQLWSLKPNIAPIPLTVFQGDEGIIIPVDYEAGTATYALTIEPFGGQESPSLENLIGTVTI